MGEKCHKQHALCIPRKGAGAANFHQFCDRTSWRLFLRNACAAKGVGLKFGPPAASTFLRRSFALCRHFGMVLPQLEAWFLSREAGCGEIPAALLHAAQHRRGELHISALRFREDTTGLVRRHSRGFSFFGKGSPANHTYQEITRRGRGRTQLPRRIAAVKRSRQTRVRALPAAAILERRFHAASRFSPVSSDGTFQLRVPPSFVVHG